MFVPPGAASFWKVGAGGTARCFILTETEGDFIDDRPRLDIRVEGNMLATLVQNNLTSSHPQV